MARTSARTLLFVCDNLGPMHADRLAALARALPADRQVVAIELHARSEVYAWVPERRPDYAQHTLVSAGARCGSFRLAIRLLQAAFAYPNADCYLCHYERPPIMIAAAVLRLAGRRVFALANAKFDDRPRRLRRERWKALALRPYHGALCGSPRTIDYLAFLGLPRARLVLGYNTLAVDRIAGLAATPPAPAGPSHAERAFVAMARFVPEKNLALLIDAYAAWASTAAAPRALHLCGGGPLEEELRAQIARLGLSDRVHLHPFLQADGVAHLLSRALCLLLPSRREQFGNVVIEAQALGVPVLVSSVAGAADLLVDGGSNGFVLAPDRPEPWTATMRLLAEDEALWTRMAQAAHADCRRGDVARFVEGVSALSGLPPRSAPAPTARADD